MKEDPIKEDPKKVMEKTSIDSKVSPSLPVTATLSNAVLHKQTTGGITRNQVTVDISFNGRLGNIGTPTKVKSGSSYTVTLPVIAGTVTGITGYIATSYYDDPSNVGCTFFTIDANPGNEVVIDGDDTRV